MMCCGPPTPTKGLARLYRVFSLGTTIIIDRQGRISYRDGGATSYKVLYSQVKELL